MEMTFDDALKFMLDNGYMAVVKNKYMVTAKFNKAATGVEQGLMLLNNNVPVVKEPGIPKTLDWRALYLRFIMEAGVPKQIRNGKGELYQTNAYSDAGRKAFQKALEKDKVDYQKLVEATAAYYKGNIEYKVAIGRFMEEGMWITAYQELMNPAPAGVKQPSNGEYSRYHIG